MGLLGDGVLDLGPDSSLRGVWRSSSPGGRTGDSPGGGVTLLGLRLRAGLGGVLGPLWDRGGGGALLSTFGGGDSLYLAGGL